LVDSLELVIATAPPQQAKVLLRILITELRLQTARQISGPNYRVTIPDGTPPFLAGFARRQ
jgi:hypothetical protein